jgi:F420-dependent oxidoreductase-like protein
MRIGIMGNAANSGTIEQVVDEARRAAEDGLHTYWLPQIFGHDALTVLAIVGREVPGIELGTAVVPTYPRHPMMLAQQALTVQSSISTPGAPGRLALGVGLSHQIVVEMMWGLSFDKPVRHLREYLSVMMPLLEGKPAAFSGEDFRVQGGLTISGIARPTVLVAALGTQMLRVTGTLADGTSTWCVGPKTLQDHTIATLAQAAADAGRPAPRVVAAFPICVTDDVDAARARAEQVFAVYNTLPSYKAMMDREGVNGPRDLAVVGSEAEVRDQLAELGPIGVTDLNAAAFPGNPDETERTRSVLRSLASGQ